jgi:hypothetical protein
MSMVIFPLLLLLTLGPGPGTPEHVLNDFSRFSRAIGSQVSLVDVDGTVREGLVIAATENEVAMRFGAGTRTFSRPVIESAERLRDGRKDGAIKGAIFGAVIGLIVTPFYETTGQKLGGFATSVAIYSGMGWGLDAAQNHRQAIYKAKAPSTGVKVSLRF